MAGRPLKMAERVAGFEERGMELLHDIGNAIPEQYFEKLDARDPICRAWRDAVEQTAHASIAHENLGDLLRQKAGITEPGPWALQRVEWEEGKTGSDGG